MSRLYRTLAFTLAVSVCFAGLALAAKPKPKAKPKAAAKKTTTQPHYVQGTTQLAGETAVFGTTYTLGKDDPWNITLNSAEYSVHQLRTGENTDYPTGEQKLLILHFNVHNPRNAESFLRYDSLQMTAVDAKDTNWEQTSNMGSEKTREGVAMSLKPAQKIDVYTAIPVPAPGEIPKLIIKGSNDLVLRYDLRGKVKGLPAPYADPNDKTGATALAKIKAEKGTYYPLGMIDVKIDGVTVVDTPIGDRELEEGLRNYVFAMVIKNISGAEQFVRYDTFDVKAFDPDGNELGVRCDMLQSIRNVGVAANVQPGQEIKVRYIMEAPKDVDPQTITMGTTESRKFVYDWESLK